MTTARAYKVVAFAEENNSEALDEKGKKESVIQIMARELAIPRRHCDPTVRNEQCCDFSGERYSRAMAFLEGTTESIIQQRIEKSMRDGEHYWFEQLQEFNMWPVLFICGAVHSLLFFDLLQANNIDAVFLAKDWNI
ncbi:MAG: hypothetical protein LZF64_12245 [Nitrosomonas sp.]|nr:hypothetical protein [Nitrosomonas sp.]MCG7757775.1 hypothetical protein [Nitrosomonas sp.]UJO99931.1 MAG: hypothetical protein LZF64_12245 [Nitrosomonas sp.]